MSASPPFAVDDGLTDLPVVGIAVECHLRCIDASGASASNNAVLFSESADLHSLTNSWFHMSQKAESKPEPGAEVSSVMICAPETMKPGAMAGRER